MTTTMHASMKNSGDFRAHVTALLREKGRQEKTFKAGLSVSPESSAVLFLLSAHGPGGEKGKGPYLVLNKRSYRVKQPGDLCFPGGRVSPRLDRLLSALLRLPFSPLTRWPDWQVWKRNKIHEAGRLALLLATSLRESLEEMRLNPLGIRFLGPLPAQDLQLFRRTIYPMVGWINGQKRFFPNWEVEKIVSIPLKDFSNPDQYACCRFHFEIPNPHGPGGHTEDFPCFLHQSGGEREVLWGVTYRMIMVFLETVFHFNAPERKSLRIIHGTIGERYMKGGA